MCISRPIFKTLFFCVLLMNYLARPVAAEDPVQIKPLNPIKITAVIPADSPPTYFIDPKTNKPSGFAVDILDRIAALSGMEVSYTVGYGWNEIIGKIRSGEADLIPEIGISEERAKELAFTKPLDTFPVSVFVRAHSDIKALKKDITIGVIRESFAYEKIRNIEGIHITTYKSYSQGLYDLLAGRVDAFACPVPVFLRLARDAGMEDLIKITPDPLGEVKRAIAVRKDNVILLDRLNKVMDRFTGSVEYRQIYQKWYGKPEPFWTRRNIIIMVLSAAMLTFILTAFWRHRSIVELKERYRQIVELSPSAVYVQCEGKIAFINSAGVKLFGASSADQIVGRPVLHFIHPDYREIVSERIEQLRKNNVTVPLIDQKYLRFDGSSFDAEVVAASFTYRGKPAAEVVARDITERKRMDEKVENLRRQNELILNSVGEGILGLDLEGRQTFVNPAAARMLGYSPKELIGQKSHGIWHHTKIDGKAYPAEECPIYATLKDGTICRVRNEVFWKNDGTSFPVSYACTPIMDKGAITGAVVTFRDITERKQAEEEKLKLENQLFHAQKMEAIGQLAGGVAHDFNNIISAIIGFGSLMQMKIKDEKSVRHYLDQILALTGKAAAVTKGLLTFSRKEELDMKPLKLNEAVGSTGKLLHSLLGEEVKLCLELSENDITVMGDSSQIDQVLMNLAINARDAMPAGGILTISTESFDMDDIFIAIHGYGNPGKYGVISVGDNGQGMDEKTRVRIFEPFFTTKEIGKGTGLGLAIVYGIIKQHNGFINVYSEPGRGTTFRIYLPLANAIAEEPETMQYAVALGSETILIAEDADPLRKVTKTILEEFGYSVIEAEDGEDAVKIFEKNKDKIDLVLLDVIMPKMNGRRACEEIRKIKPDTKVIFTSGYTGDIILKSKLIEDGFAFVPKPISPRHLMGKIRDLMDKKT